MPASAGSKTKWRWKVLCWATSLNIKNRTKQITSGIMQTFLGRGRLVECWLLSAEIGVVTDNFCRQVQHSGLWRDTDRFNFISGEKICLINYWPVLRGKKIKELIKGQAFVAFLYALWVVGLSLGKKTFARAFAAKKRCSITVCSQGILSNPRTTDGRKGRTTKIPVT